MIDIIKQVKTSLTFHFKNGDTFLLSAYSDGSTLDNYATSIKISEKLYESSGTNIIGNIHCSSLSLELKSLDKELVSTNQQSQFYGYMNNTAYIDVYVGIPEEGIVDNAMSSVYMGRYYIETWENNTSSSEPYKVSIYAVDVLSRIKNIELGMMRLSYEINVNEYLGLVIDKINSLIGSEMQLSYDNSSLDIFKDTEYASDWQLYFNNIDRTNIENIFNDIAQNTASFIWIDRNRKVQTDCLLNDNQETAVSSLSGSTNILEYGIQTGDIDDYDGVIIDYIDNVSYEDKQVGIINDFSLRQDTDDYNGLSLNSDNILSINLISIDCDSDNETAYVNSFENYKRVLNMNITASNSTQADINIFGTIINYQRQQLSLFKQGINKGEQINIENNILRKELVNSYGNHLITMMTNKNRTIKCNGFINPRVKLGDIVSFTGTRLGVSDNYKVVGLDFELNSSYRCNALLTKTS